MANRIRSLAEKVQSVAIALGQINVEAAARETGVAASTLRYDLNKVTAALPEILVNLKPGPKPEGKAAAARVRGKFGIRVKRYHLSREMANASSHFGDQKGLVWL